MKNPTATIALEGESIRLGGAGASVARRALVVAAGALAVAVLATAISGCSIRRAASAYLVNYVFFLSLALGALMFVILQHLTRAGWSVTVRRIAEVVASTLWIWALAAIPVLLAGGSLYEWFGGGHGHGASAHAAGGLKSVWLTAPFFVVRLCAYFAVWCWLARVYYQGSLAQDRSGDYTITNRLERLSPVAAILWALSASLFAYDVIMALDQHWYSTIFGVYFFAGCMVGFLSFLIIVSVLLQKSGRLESAVGPEHYHILGKLLFGFVMFWAYIAFSQYMLIWYAHMPEETGWYKVRLDGQWAWVGWLLVFGHFAVPYLGIMSRHVKRRRVVLATWAAWLLLMHWTDLFWQMIPPQSPGRIDLRLVDVALFVAFAAAFVAALASAAKSVSLIPEQDPRLQESLTHVNA